MENTVLVTGIGPKDFHQGTNNSHSWTSMSFVQTCGVYPYGYSIYKLESAGGIDNVHMPSTCQKRGDTNVTPFTPIQYWETWRDLHDGEECPIVHVMYIDDWYGHYNVLEILEPVGGGGGSPEGFLRRGANTLVFLGQ